MGAVVSTFRLTRNGTSDNPDTDMRLELFCEDGIGLCSGPLEYWKGQYPGIFMVEQLMPKVSLAIALDFNTTLSTLQGLTYPCTENAWVRAPPLAVAWDCYTAAAASLGPLLFVITVLLKFFHKPDTTETSTQSIQLLPPASLNPNDRSLSFDRFSPDTVSRKIES